MFPLRVDTKCPNGNDVVDVARDRPRGSFRSCSKRYPLAYIQLEA